MQVMTADQATALIHDGDTIVIGGSGSGHAIPEALIEAVERRFLATAAPRSITSLHPVGLGDRSHRGISHFAHPGLLKRVVCGTVVDARPRSPPTWPTAMKSKPTRCRKARSRN